MVPTQSVVKLCQDTEDETDRSRRLAPLRPSRCRDVRVVVFLLSTALLEGTLCLRKFRLKRRPVCCRGLVETAQDR